MRRKAAMMLSGLAGLALLTTTPALAQDDSGRLTRQLLGQSALQGAELERVVAAADAHPLGSSANPVRVSRPAGERAYLARLRCSDGTAPQYLRRGSVGIGAFGNIVDLYDVRCGAGEPAASAVYMDMYHSAHDEQRSLAGFTLATSKGPPVLSPLAPPPPTTPSQLRVQDPTA